MRLEHSAADYLPERRSLKALREAAAHCRGCDLYRHATQTVFGEGRARARLMLVGEQPGDSEDRLGHPFVGPAGRVLHDTMLDAGVDPRSVYVTNTVKHFKFIERGKKRIHQKPRVIEIQACIPWLQAEIAQIKPQLVVALGATAAQALLGSAFRVTKHRGEILASPFAEHVLATVHPSSILRAPDAETRRVELAAFLKDLKKAALFAGSGV
ncbi:MAG TPA: UdgX family uracil-DNA binding protein [Candidatus Baltobacteraceae bacterium]|nr:UdgX family uracil-DNA binding protein [Candidatus Baltobacteraceae bacterium]